MKKNKQTIEKDLRPEYRREDLGPGVRGKSYRAYTKGTNLLSPEVAAAEPAFLLREGRIKVGPGDPVEDVRKARKLIGHRRP